MRLQPKVGQTGGRTAAGLLLECTTACPMDSSALQVQDGHNQLPQPARGSDGQEVKSLGCSNSQLQATLAGCSLGLSSLFSQNVSTDICTRVNARRLLFLLLLLWYANECCLHPAERN